MICLQGLIVPLITYKCTVPSHHGILQKKKNEKMKNDFSLRLSQKQVLVWSETGYL